MKETLVQLSSKELVIERKQPGQQVVHVPIRSWDGTIEPLRSFLKYTQRVKHDSQITFQPESILTEFGLKHFLPYQIETCKLAVERHHGRCIFAHEMGLGKTPQVAAMVKFYGGKCLIGVPAPKLDDFVNELKRWVDLTVHKIESRASLPPEGFVHQVYVISLDLGKMIPEVMDYPWDCVVIDEAHRLRGDSTIVSESWFGPLHRARAVFMLTGTPQVSRPSDLFNLLHAVCPEVFHDRKAFSARYSGGRLVNKIWEEKPPFLHQEELGIILSHFMIRRKAEESDEFTRVIKKIRLPSNTVLPQRKQFVTPIREKGETMRIWRETNAAKQATVFPMMYDAIMAMPSGQSALVFFYQIPNMKKFAAYLKERGLNNEAVCCIDGSVPVKKRQKLLEGVCSGATRVALLTLCSSAEALNITPAATHVFFPELPFVPSLLVQAEGRAHRKGQIYPVKSFWYVAVGTFDDTVFGILMRKLSCSSSIVDRKVFTPG
jgi:SWI/SNF-related matrix-associated actin-dependent regulator 1 of chromatin subfamily A